MRSFNLYMMIGYLIQKLKQWLPVLFLHLRYGLLVTEKLLNMTAVERYSLNLECGTCGMWIKTLHPANGFL